MLAEFANFVREKGVIGLAVGIVTGGAVTKMVSSLVENLINPLIGSIVGGVDLSAMTFTVGSAVYKYGAVMSSLIDLIAVLLVVYLVFVKSPLNKMDKKA
jgi:large conductance mechanosensitive channel